MTEQHTLEEKKETPSQKTEQKKASEEKVEKKETRKIEKKEFARSNAAGLHISLKHAMAISKFIKGKTIDRALQELSEVTSMKRAVPFKGEIPHRHGMMSGRYPINASEAFIQVLKGLKGNTLVNGMDLQKTVIVSSNPSWAARPMRRGGRKGKRINLIIEARERTGGKA